jgi:multiple sugar transport system ATP-binding protein
MNFLRCRVGEGGRTLHLPGGTDLPVPARRIAECARHVGRELDFGLRPEHIGSAHRDEPDTTSIDGKVMLVEPLGSDTLALVRLGTRDGAGEMTGRYAPEAALRVGDPIRLSLALSKFHLFDPETGAAVRGAGW